jgi:hypothetical protein
MDAHAMRPHVPPRTLVLLPAPPAPLHCGHCPRLSYACPSLDVQGANGGMGGVPAWLITHSQPLTPDRPLIPTAAQRQEPPAHCRGA